MGSLCLVVVCDLGEGRQHVAVSAFQEEDNWIAEKVGLFFLSSSSSLICEYYFFSEPHA
jgi:cupin superfamily acireductone dioxygenase involved in methionine salvage